MKFDWGTYLTACTNAFVSEVRAIAMDRDTLRLDISWKYLCMRRLPLYGRVPVFTGNGREVLTLPCPIIPRILPVTEGIDP